MTLDSYNLLCDDFYVDMFVNTQLELPMQRDTVLTFFERIRKQFPSMGSFYRRENNQYCLEEDHSTGAYRWVTLERERVGSGVVNPLRFEEAYSQGRLVIELMPYMLNVSNLDINSLDVTFAMDFDYSGNHDEVIAEALLGSSVFSCLLDMPDAHPVSLSPSVVVAISADALTQARISVESKMFFSETERRYRQGDEAISMSFSIRRYHDGSAGFDPAKSFEDQCRLVEELMVEKIIPNFVRPLNSVIAEKRLT